MFLCVFLLPDLFRSPTVLSLLFFSHVVVVPYMKFHHSFQNCPHLFLRLSFQLIELQRSQFQNQEDFRQQIKVASFIAGLQGKPVVLFVPEGVDDEAMQDICSLMAEGKEL